MKKKIFVGLLVGTLLCGCGTNNESTSYLENVPDPVVFFSESDCSEYAVDTLNLKGITVNYSGDDIRSSFEEYVDTCKNSGVWVNPVFDGDDSWCYQNEDGSMQIAINLYEENNRIDICIKILKED